MGFSYKAGARRPDARDANGEFPLPPAISEYLSSSVAEGGRNRALFDAAAQCRDIDMSPSEALNLVGAKAQGDGLGNAEIEATIESAYRAPKREGPRRAGGSSGNAGAGRNYQIAGARRFSPAKKADPLAPKPLSGATPLPVPAPIEGGFESFILAAFEEGEGICISRARETDDEDVVPTVGVTLTREDWLERVRRKGGIEKVESGKLGLYVRMNPMKPLCEKALNEDVTAFRHVLVEFDTDSEGVNIPKEKQFGMMVASDLPITAVIDSGNKSLHAWVRVDAENAEQYKERANQVYALFPDIDGQNHNPNRLSRAPDGFRTVADDLKRQRLLKLGLGADSFGAWLATSEAKAHGESIGIRELLEYDVPNDPNRVIGDRWLCKGGSLVIVAPSGVGKSALTSQLAAGWAGGISRLTFGIEAIEPLRQIIFQAENDKGDLAEGIQGVIRGAQITEEEIDLIDKNLRFQTITTLTGEAFLSAVEGYVKSERPALVWIDPLLNFIGDDASKAEVVSKFCVEGLNAIGKSTGTIFALIHHTAKPKGADAKKGQTATDLAYAGFGSSGLTNWAREVAVLERLEDTEEGQAPKFRFTATKRRLRAGMRTMTPDEDGAPMDGHPTDHIYIQHAVGRIAWIQCPTPETPEEVPKWKRGEKQESQQPSPTLRPSSLTGEQKLMIAEAVAANDGNPIIGGQDLLALARKIGKSDRTIRRYLASIAEGQEQARKELEEG